MLLIALLVLPDATNGELNGLSQSACYGNQALHGNPQAARNGGILDRFIPDGFQVLVRLYIGLLVGVVSIANIYGW
jgi:hypothetical protein